MASSSTRRSRGKSIVKDEEFDEEEMWDCVSERAEEASSGSAWRFQSNTSKMMIPKAKTAANQESKMAKRFSAPLEIPDWSKIYGKNAHMDPWMDDACHGRDDDDDDDGMVPPHEWIARKLARRQIWSFSVCEGIGRTLKGRDLSKLRNAILTKTGFLE